MSHGDGQWSGDGRQGQGPRYGEDPRAGQQWEGYTHEQQRPRPHNGGGYDARDRGKMTQAYGEPGGYGGAPAAPGAGDRPASKGFFGALFDFSFTYFVTPMIVKVVYVLVTIALVVGWLGWTVVGFAQDPALGVLFLFGGALVVLVYLAIARMTLEFYLAVVRMSEDIHHRLR